MGPGSQQKDSLGIDPPPFNPQNDLHEWRRRVAKWVDYIKETAEKGVDKRNKTIYSTLGTTLYYSLPRASQKIIDRKQELGLIDYKQENQLLAVKQIVRLLTPDSPIATVTFLIESFNKVMSCKRDAREKLSVFVQRFYGLASEHLTHANETSASPVGEVLAITLLNNANLPDTTLTNAKSELIKLAELNAEKEKNFAHSLPISMSTMCKLNNASKKLREVCNGVKISKSSSALEKYRNAYYKTVSQVRDEVSNIEAAISEVDDEKDQTDADKIISEIKCSKMTCTLNLDDAVAYLNKLNINPTEAPSYNNDSVKSLVAEHLKELMNQHGKQALLAGFGGDKSAPVPPKTEDDKPTPDSGRNRGGYRRGGRGFKRKEPEYCRDCGSSDHKRADEKCPTPCFETRKRREVEDKAQNNPDLTQGDKASDFRRGSRK